jgi:hypothetical protein
MPSLSVGTKERIAALFPEVEQPLVTRLLENCLADQVEFWKMLQNAEGLERIHFAVLKLSDGTLVKLQDAIRLAETDWRDVLVASGFANDPVAHRSWASK